MKTAQSTRAVEMIGPDTSPIAWRVAAMGSRPRAMFRSTFSTTTMASSTDDADGEDQAEQGQGVQAEAQHQQDREGPDQGQPARASKGMIEARHPCRNSTTTMTTSTMASNRVCSTALIDSCTKPVVS